MYSDRHIINSQPELDVIFILDGLSLHQLTFGTTGKWLTFSPLTDCFHPKIQVPRIFLQFSSSINICVSSTDILMKKASCGPGSVLDVGD